MGRLPALSRPSAVAAASVGLGALAVLAELHGRVVFPWIDLIGGCSLIVAGMITVGRPLERLSGVLLLAAGVTWFVATADLAGPVAEPMNFVHRALVVHAVLAHARITPMRAIVVGVAYVGAIDDERALSPAWLLSIAAGTLIVLTTDVVAQRIAIRAAIPAGFGVALWTAAVAWLLPHDMFEPEIRFALYTGGLALTAATVATWPRLSHASSSTADRLVRDGGSRDVRIGFRDDLSGPLLDISGTPMTVGHRDNSMRVPSDDGAETVIVLPRYAVAPAALPSGLIDATRLLRTHRSALMAARAQARQIAESEDRIRTAEVLASNELAWDLDHSVIAVLERARQRFADDSDAETQATQRSLLGIIDELETIVRGLVPADLSTGLEPALHEFATRITTPMSMTIDPIVLSDRATTALWFVISEAVTNAIRHGEACSIDVRLHEIDGGAVLTISDDGRGGATVRDGGGLCGLRQRLAQLGGSLEVSECAGGGTVVTARLRCDTGVNRSS